MQPQCGTLCGVDQFQIPRSPGKGPGEAPDPGKKWFLFKAVKASRAVFDVAPPSSTSSG